ncbi:MAG: hypothetical protein IKS37_07940, partial [Solobacterium sp.]|nr:hypothetical protein [Solobacterium sp.]
TSILIIIMIPVTAWLLDRFADFYTLSLAVSFNIWTSVLIMYDWSLFGIHYNRVKKNPVNSLIFAIIGMILIGIWLWIGQNFLHSNILIAGGSVLRRYGYARPAMLAAFSFMQAAVVNIGFKCLTDHLAVRSGEVQAILISGFLFGFLMTAIFTVPPFSIGIFVTSYLYYFGLTAILSYLYRESTSFMPGLVAMGTVYLFNMLLSLAALH